MNNDEPVDALNGRMQVIKANGGEEGWFVICDGAPMLHVKDRWKANSIFQLMIRAHQIGREDALYDVRRVIGV